VSQRAVMWQNTRRRVGDLRCPDGVRARPLDDYLAALSVCVTPISFGRVLIVALAFVATWWVYVPVHELAHALGCVLTGGMVTRLEIDPLYGAALLRKVFPFVAVGSAYAGQLTGFDTHGSDLTYLATDFCPFLLTILVGIPLLRSIRADSGRPLLACAKFGAALPIAYAPFMSIAGDYYEMGSIIVSRCVALWSPSFRVGRWRSDDLFKLCSRLFFSNAPIRVGDVAGVVASLLVGTILIFVTYWIGTLWARLIRRRAMPA
jgi:hypothetical protein